MELLDPLGILTIVVLLVFSCQCLRVLRIRWKTDDLSEADGRYSRKPGRGTKSNVLTGQYTACQSPECVRCHRYQTIRAHSYDHLCRYAENCSSWVGLDRIKEAVEKPPIATVDMIREHKQTMYLEQAPNVLFVPGLSAVPWWSCDNFKQEMDTLQNHFGTMKKEFEEVFEVYNTNTIGWMQNSTPNGTWSVFHLYNQGKKVLENCDRCPKTTLLTESLTNSMRDCLFGNACFSVIFPNTDITGHFGPCNIRIRCHLGLTIPEHCSLTVANKRKSWEEKKCSFFDDSFYHSAHNAGSEEDGPRVVFMVDFWHPGLTQKERNALSYMF